MNLAQAIVYRSDAPRPGVRGDGLRNHREAKTFFCSGASHNPENECNPPSFCSLVYPPLRFGILLYCRCGARTLVLVAQE